MAISSREATKESSVDLLLQMQEHILYPEVVAALVDGRISWREDGIPILWKPQ